MDETGDDQHYDAKANPAGLSDPPPAQPTSLQGLDGPRPTLPPAAVALDAAVAPAMVARQLGKC